MINCRGCYTFNECGIVNREDADECPCGICLIKVICDKMCSHYSTFLLAVIDILLEEQQVFDASKIYEKYITTSITEGNENGIM